jgi:hypothetical protein
MQEPGDGIANGAESFNCFEKAFSPVPVATVTST